MTDKLKVLEYSKFNSTYKKILKKFRHCFEKDYNNAIKVITKGPFFYDSMDKLPKTDRISQLGQHISLPVYKTRIYIKQANGLVGRIVYIYDEELDQIFLVEVYYKSDQSNHDSAKINDAFQEYDQIRNELLGIKLSETK